MCYLIEPRSYFLLVGAAGDDKAPDVVGAKEIVEALADDGYYIKAEQVVLPHPLRQLDNVSVDLRLTDGVTSSIKVWVVREKSEVGRTSTSSIESSKPGGTAKPPSAPTVSWPNVVAALDSRGCMVL